MITADRAILHSDLNHCELNDYEQHQRSLTLETTIDEIRRRIGTVSINFASHICGLKMQAYRVIEHRTPSPMYQ